jgi:hypothetical protein
MSALEELMHAALTAPPQRREAALSVLRGQARGGDPTEWPTVAEPYLTLRETARRLGLSAATLGRWRIPGHGLGGRRRCGPSASIVPPDDRRQNARAPHPRFPHQSRSYVTPTTREATAQRILSDARHRRGQHNFP